MNPFLFHPHCGDPSRPTFLDWHFGQKKLPGRSASVSERSAISRTVRRLSDSAGSFSTRFPRWSAGSRTDSTGAPWPMGRPIPQAWGAAMDCELCRVTGPTEVYVRRILTDPLAISRTTYRGAFASLEHMGRMTSDRHIVRSRPITLIEPPRHRPPRRAPPLVAWGSALLGSSLYAGKHLPRQPSPKVHREPMRHGTLLLY